LLGSDESTQNRHTLKAVRLDSGAVMSKKRKLTLEMSCPSQGCSITSLNAQIQKLKTFPRQNFDISLIIAVFRALKSPISPSVACSVVLRAHAPNRTQSFACCSVPDAYRTPAAESGVAPPKKDLIRLFSDQKRPPPTASCIIPNPNRPNSMPYVFILHHPLLPHGSFKPVHNVDI
jgi:hypothetical protein